MNLATTCRKLVCAKVNIFQFRGYSSSKIENMLNLTWYRPSKVPETDPKQSGDLGTNVIVKPTDYGLRYEHAEELNNASDIVKQLCSVRFLGQKEMMKVRRAKTIALVKRHIADHSSIEVEIAKMTNEIQYLQENLQKQPRNKLMKKCLKELIDKRKKFLNYLRRWDYRRFEWILERLNLIYVPTPQKLGRVSRKDSLRLLAKDYCENIIEKKLDAYKNELKKKQMEFYQNKVQKLMFILNEEKTFDLPRTVTEEEIEATRKKIAELQDQ